MFENPNKVKFAFLSILFFSLLMAFLYYDPLLYYLFLWIGNRAFVPYVSMTLIAASVYFSLRFFYHQFRSKEFSFMGLVMALPIFIWMSWWLIRLISRV